MHCVYNGYIHNADGVNDMATVTKTQLREIAESKGFELVDAWEVYMGGQGQRKCWGIKKDGQVKTIGRGKEALDNLLAA
jgi:hypothetical protein